RGPDRAGKGRLESGVRDALRPLPRTGLALLPAADGRRRTRGGARAGHLRRDPGRRGTLSAAGRLPLVRVWRRLQRAARRPPEGGVPREEAAGAGTRGSGRRRSGPRTLGPSRARGARRGRSRDPDAPRIRTALLPGDRRHQAGAAQHDPFAVVSGAGCTEGRARRRHAAASEVDPWPLKSSTRPPRRNSWSTSTAKARPLPARAFRPISPPAPPATPSRRTTPSPP